MGRYIKCISLLAFASIFLGITVGAYDITQIADIGRDDIIAKNRQSDIRVMPNIDMSKIFKDMESHINRYIKDIPLLAGAGLFLGIKAGVNYYSTKRRGDLDDGYYANIIKNRHADIRVMPIIDKHKKFKDTSGHLYEEDILALAMRGCISGVSDDTFAPDKTITRAEFAAIIVKSLGLQPIQKQVFTDVPSNVWYNGYVATASSYGIITGKTSTTFAPNDNITRQEAAVMLTRVAALCGFDTSMDADEIEEELSECFDRDKVADWAREGLAFQISEYFVECLMDDDFPRDESLMDDYSSMFYPEAYITRGEVAYMIYELFDEGELL